MAEIKEHKVLLTCLQPSACGMCAGGSLNTVLLIGSSRYSSAQFHQIPMEKSVPLFQKNNGQLVISTARQGKGTLRAQEWYFYAVKMVPTGKAAISVALLHPQVCFSISKSNMKQNRVCRLVKTVRRLPMWSFHQHPGSLLQRECLQFQICPKHF